MAKRITPEVHDRHNSPCWACGYDHSRVVLPPGCPMEDTLWHQGAVLAESMADLGRTILAPFERLYDWLEGQWARRS